jgi:uncharacterized protein
MIFEQTLQLLLTKYLDLLQSVAISDVRIGQYLTAVRLSDGSCGTSATLPGDGFHCEPGNRDFGDFTPLKIKGQSVLSLLESEKKSQTVLTLKIAVLNAISSHLISKGSYKIIENCDPVDLIDLTGPRVITIVGAFQSYLKKISATDNKLNVLELNPAALTEDQRKYYVPANDYKKVLPGSDLVIITGLTLVNLTIDGLLESVNSSAEVIVTGPSSSVIPDILFANKVSIIGATRITDPGKLFDIVGESGTGYHLFKYCAQKISILKNDET